MMVAFVFVSAAGRMGNPRSLFDAFNSELNRDASAVAGETERILAQCFGAGSFDGELLHASFAVVERLFAGELPGYLACDMPYHDLRHSIDTALVMARLVDGYQVEHSASAVALTPEYGLLGVLLGLLHDTGLIRRTSEAALCGPQLMADHESRSVEFARSQLQATSLANRATLATLIFATRLGADLDALFAGHQGPAVTLGHMLGSADLVSQIADPRYLERCYYHLYPELVLGGRDRTRAPDGQERLLYRDAFDLLRNTPQFYETIARKRLHQDFKHMVRHLRVHFGGDDPYAEAIQRNLDRSARIAADGDTRLLGDRPTTTTKNLAAIYRARPARPAAAH